MSSPVTIDRILPGIAAIDVGSERHYVAVAGEAVRWFASFTVEVRKLCAFLQEQNVTRVAMEATGVYWMPLYDALQQAGLHVTLFNGAHARNLPGRKSDVQDCEWHAMLHSHGLLQPCFVTPEAMRPLRTYCRRREEIVAQAAEYIQQMQRACDEMNVRLHQVISQLHGVSGLRVIDAILAGVPSHGRCSLCATGASSAAKRKKCSPAWRARGANTTSSSSGKPALAMDFASSNWPNAINRSPPR